MHVTIPLFNTATSSSHPHAHHHQPYPSSSRRLFITGPILTLLALILLARLIIYSPKPLPLSVSIPSLPLSITNPFSNNPTLLSQQQRKDASNYLDLLPTWKHPPELPSTFPSKLYNHLFTSYAIRHKAALQRLRENPTNITDKFLIWTCAPGRDNCAGVADRFRGILNVYILAVLTNRIFGIEWRTGEGGYSGGLEKVFVPWLEEGGIDWMSVPKLVGDRGVTLPWYRCEGGGVARKCGKGGVMPYTRELPRPPPKMYWDDDQGWDYGAKGSGSFSLLEDDIGEVLGDAPVIRVGTRFFFKMAAYMENKKLGKIADEIREASDNGLTDEEVQRILMRWLFKPTEGLVRRMRRFQVNLRQSSLGEQQDTEIQTRPLLGTDYVGVHVRNGADFHEHLSQRRFKDITDDRTGAARKLLKCMRQLGYGSGTMFLGTDDYEFKKSMVAVVRKENWNWKVTYNDAMALHNDLGPVKRGDEAVYQNYSAVDLRKWNFGDGDPFVDIFVDLFMIGHGKIVMGATSSGFTRLAFTLGRSTTIATDAFRECKTGGIKESWIHEVGLEKLAKWL